MSRALEMVESEGLTRIPVVDAGDRLQGLVCFNATYDAFCVYPSSEASSAGSKTE